MADKTYQSGMYLENCIHVNLILTNQISLIEKLLGERSRENPCTYLSNTQDRKTSITKLSKRENQETVTAYARAVDEKVKQ